MKHPLDKPTGRLSVLQPVLFLLTIIALWSLEFVMLSAKAAERLTFTWPVRQYDIKPPLNLDKLCRAIAVAETEGCTTGMAVTKNNCHGIMTWSNGRRSGRVFASHEESQQACISLWARSYKVFPTPALATRYTGNDVPDRWLSVVTDHYYR